MCRILTIAVLLLSLTAAQPSSASATLAWLDSCRVVIGGFQYDQTYGSLATDVQLKLPEYERLMDRAFTDVRGLHIDVLLQMHIGQDIKADSETARSQDAVYDLLTRGRYDVIATEGGHSDPFNPEALIRETLETQKTLLHIPISAADSLAYVEMLPVMLAGNGALRYQVNHPRSVVIGLDEMPPTLLDYSLISVLDGGYGTPELWQLHRMASRLRAELGAAKLILKLKTLKKTRGALVIGLLHENELRELFDRLRLKGQFYNTTSTNP